MTISEMKVYQTQRAKAVQKKQVNNNVKYENGILLHAIPHDLLKTKPIDWNDRAQSDCPKIAFRRFFSSQIQYEPTTDGLMGYTDREYTIWFDNGIIETFTSPIIRTTETPNAQRVNYVQVESILMHSKNFMNAYLDAYEKCYKIGLPHTILISLIGVQGVFFYARERNYTTTLPCPTHIYFFPIVTITVQNRQNSWQYILETIHKTLMQSFL